MSTPLDSWTTVRADLLRAMGAAEEGRGNAEGAGASYAVTSRFVDELVELRRAYADALPQIPIGSNPFDNSLVTVALDTQGLDGPYWDAQNPARPAESMPASFVGLTGAMGLAPGSVEFTEHLCLPGPQVPFVVPELLGRPGVTAVLTTVTVGSHTGYAVSYFSPRSPEGPPLPNEWGRREYWIRKSGEPVTMGTSFDNLPEPDFDLGPWIDRGKVGWVAPGDDTYLLNWEREDCPYLDLPGARRFQRVQAGEVF